MHRSGAVQGARTLVFVAHAVGIQPVSVPPHDRFYGDFIWFDGRRYDKEHEDVIGRHVVRCEETTIATVACEGTYNLRGRGKLFTRFGKVSQADPASIGAIVGGAGEFIGADGQAVIADAFRDPTFDLKLEITLTH
jgi:hypothetical protein